MKRPYYQHCPRAAASRSARTSTTASSGSDGGAARPCTPTPPPPFGPLWAATRAATRDDFFDSGGGGGTSAGGYWALRPACLAAFSVFLKSYCSCSSRGSSKGGGKTTGCSRGNRSFGTPRSGVGTPRSGVPKRCSVPKRSNTGFNTPLPSLWLSAAQGQPWKRSCGTRKRRPRTTMRRTR